MPFPVIPQNLSITAMRSSGYKDTAHALAELIDNAIQSGQEVNRPTLVEVICLERPQSGSRPKITEIAVLDNAGGMSSDTLRAALQFGNGSRLEPKKQTGIGKFGMGLPNSSISQGQRVDVWSWQNGLTLHSFIDVEQMRQGKLVEVPEPQHSTVPSEWLKVFLTGIGKSGTLVVWSMLDRVTWKQSATLLRHVEFLSGRIYRRFIKDKTASIRLAAYEVGQGEYISKWEGSVRPNDPLYLMTGTSAPEPYDQRPAFDLFAEKKISVSFRNAPYEIDVRASMAKPELRVQGGGARPIGKHAKRNQGVSVMRAGRELEMNKSFENPDFRERWWGIEVDFPPALDDLFGVTNNKQSATGFQRMVFEDDAEAEDMKPDAYRALMEREGDLRLPMYMISDEVEKLIRQMRAEILRRRNAEVVASSEETLSRKVERTASISVTKRQDRVGRTGLSDKQEDEQSEEDRAESLAADIVDEGVEPNRARDIAVGYVKAHSKFRIRHASLPTSAMFDVSATGGVIVITFNTRHVVHAKVFAQFQETGETSPLAKELLSMIIAWARMEDEASSRQIRTALEETREAWGRMAKDFFEPDEA